MAEAEAEPDADVEVAAEDEVVALDVEPPVELLELHPAASRAAASAAVTPSRRPRARNGRLVRARATSRLSLLAVTCAFTSLCTYRSLQI
jgi:hypothetical protein